MSRVWVLVVALLAPGLCAAQREAPGEPVTIPGAEFSRWKVEEVSGRFGHPATAPGKVPAVLILHGSAGVDGRGAFYASALQEAGLATLEIVMFQPRGRPRDGTRATMPHAAAALRWLAARPDVNAERLGVIGFSWGGWMSVLLASELVQKRLGNDVPRPAAFAAFYPSCTSMARSLSDPQHAFFGAHQQMGATPMLIHIGTRDDYEEGAKPCDRLVAMWPEAARSLAIVRNVEGATHGFDTQVGDRRFFDENARAGRGGQVTVYASHEAAAEARKAVVRLFVEHLSR